ncbi:hypothetical protein GGR57DRAFT_496096 [Xylariaceae sp. FL1272]|nr:hypothetical protein GGR57DRAFT_496096 [Xylariaceae sp. FL1272]
MKSTGQVSVPEVVTFSNSPIVNKFAGRHFNLDTAVRRLIEKHEHIKAVVPYGNANWATTAKITTLTANHQVKQYFLKLVSGDLAEERVISEFTCMAELYRTVPDIVPMPCSVGKCSDTDGYFFLNEYVPIVVGDLPDPVQLGKHIARLHRDSVSPSGKFGFSLHGVYMLDIKFNGRVTDFISNKVVPRLLGPLEEGGRTVKPCLIHGDLWEDNIGTDAEGGGIFIFDCGAYYAHHEMGVAMWRVKHHRMQAPEYREEYFRNYPPDEPVAEFDDRNRLYSLKESIMYSALKPAHEAREEALKDMHFLIAKYA